MQSSDIDAFFKIWDRVSIALRKPEDGREAKKTYFKLLSRFALDDVAKGLEAHMLDPERGHFMPSVSDVVRQIQRLSGNQFPGAEEAWARFPRDESLSACICDEMAAAWGVACELDEISGRMAFKEAYNRAIGKAKLENRIPVWYITRGSDKQHVEQVTMNAVTQNLISPKAATVYLPHIPQDDFEKLASGSVSANQLMLEHQPTVSGIDELVKPGDVNYEKNKIHAAALRDLLNGHELEKVS